MNPELFALYALLLLLGYFLPTWSAPLGDRLIVFVVNLTLGWTVIGWAWALHLSTRARNAHTAAVLRQISPP